MLFPNNFFSLLIALQIEIAQNGALLFYSGTPGPGDLVGAISPNGGTDRFNNSYPAGVYWAFAGVPGAYSELATQGLFLFSNFTDEKTGSIVQELGIGSGGGARGVLALDGPVNSVIDDQMQVLIQSSSASGSTVASVVFQYTDTSGIMHQLMTLAKSGLTFSNVLSIPSTPVLGGTFYSENSEPHWIDPNGLISGMVRTYNVVATGKLSSFTAETDVPGATMSVEITGSNATIVVVGTFDMEAGTSGCTFTGLFNWNGADQNPMAIFAANGVVERATTNQTWMISGISAGTYTAKLRATCSASGAANSVNQTHTGFSLFVIDM